MAVVQGLLQAGAHQAHKKDNRGATPEDEAARGEYDDIVALLHWYGGEDTRDDDELLDYEEVVSDGERTQSNDDDQGTGRGGCVLGNLSARAAER